jgi:hypothetical protein
MALSTSEPPTLCSATIGAAKFGDHAARYRCISYTWLLRTWSADGKCYGAAGRGSKEGGTFCMLQKVRMNKHLDEFHGVMPGSEGQPQTSP